MKKHLFIPLFRQSLHCLSTMEEAPLSALARGSRRLRCCRRRCRRPRLLSVLPGRGRAAGVAIPPGL